MTSVDVAEWPAAASEWTRNVDVDDEMSRAWCCMLAAHWPTTSHSLSRSSVVNSLTVKLASVSFYRATPTSLHAGARLLPLGARTVGREHVVAYIWVLGAEPPAGSRGIVPGHRPSPEVESFWVFGVKRRWQICSNSMYFSNSFCKIEKQEAFETCWAHSPLRAAARPNFTLPFTRCRYLRTPPVHRCPRQRRQQRQRVTEGTAMAPWNGPKNGFAQ